MQIIAVNKLLDLDFYTEGPAVDSQGNIYFTAPGSGFIFRLSVGGNLEQWSIMNCPNGQRIISSDYHLICDSKSATISVLDEQGYFREHVVEKYFAGLRVQSPNDLSIASNGDIYFTDSLRRTGRVFCKTAKGAEYCIASKLDYPNGIALSPDEQRLYVAESYANRILVFHRDGWGQFGGPESFADLPENDSGIETDNLPGGIAVDAAGRVWVAHYGMQCLQVLSPEGQLLETVDTGLPLTSNLFIDGERILVTGGYAEPGPGALMEIIVRWNTLP